MKVTDQLSTIGDYIRWASSEFARYEVYLGHGSDSYWDEAVFLVLGVLRQPWNSPVQVFSCRLTQDERQKLVEVIGRRVRERVPSAYLTGEAWFCNIPFYVTTDTLIPRSPIAELIEQGFSPWLSHEPRRILDLCTGNGCIGIASALIFEDAIVDLVDISEPALEVAQRNIARHRLSGQVKTVRSDLFNELNNDQSYDLIVSNPPYVDYEDLSDMPAEYHHEPSIALGSGYDGLDICRRILSEASSYLTSEGILIVEVGNSAGTLEREFPQAGFTWLEFESGGHGVFMLTRDQLISMAASE